MNEKASLQRAADEARKLARTAREFAALLDDYAKYLMQPTFRERADELHTSASNKLTSINDGLVAVNKWVQEGDSRAANTQMMEQTAKRIAKANEKQATSGRTNAHEVRIVKKDDKQ